MNTFSGVMYSENAVIHYLPGKAVQPAGQAEFIAYKCMNEKIFFSILVFGIEIIRLLKGNRTFY